MAAIATTCWGPMSATDGDLASGSKEDEGSGRVSLCNRQVSLCKFWLCSCVVFSSLQQHRRLDRSWKQGIIGLCSRVKIIEFICSKSEVLYL